MKVKFLKESEYIKWDEFVDASPQGFIFSKSYWLKIITKNDFKICVLENENEIFAGLPLPNFSQNKITNILFTQSLGILYRDMIGIKRQKILTNEKEYTKKIIEFLREKTKIKEINLNFSPKYEYWLPLYWEGFKQTTRYTYYIDYTKVNLEEEFTKFSKGHKWTLNKVEKNKDILIEETEDLDMVYSILEKTYERQGKKIGYSKEMLKNIYNVLREKNEIKIFKIFNKKDEKVHATTIFIYDKKEVYYCLGGSDIEYRKEGTHTYLIWYAINYFSKITKKFNFGGSMLEEVEKNFRNFNGELTPYFNIYWSRNWSVFYLKRLVKLFLRKEWERKCFQE